MNNDIGMMIWNGADQGWSARRKACTKIKGLHGAAETRENGDIEQGNDGQEGEADQGGSVWGRKFPAGFCGLHD